MPIYHKRVNGRKVWWVRVTHKTPNTSRVCASKEEAKRIEHELTTTLYARTRTG